MLNLQTLEEYLVSIGWSVDKASFNEALGTISEFKDTSKLLSMNAGQLLLKAGSAFIKLGWQVTKTIFDMSTAMAQTDITVERFARATASSERTARAYMRTMSALGNDPNSFKDLFLMTNEEYARFKDILRLSKSLEAPPGLQETLVKIRDIQHEQNRLKIILQYFGDWLVYFLGEELGVEIDDIKSALKGINDYLAKNIEPSAKRIAKVVAPFIKLIIKIFEALTKVVQKVTEWANQTGLLESVGGTFTAIGSTIETVIDALTELLGLNGDLTALGVTFQIIGAVLEAINTIINGIVDSVKFIIALFKGKSFVEAVQESYKNTVDSFNRGRAHIDSLFGAQNQRVSLEYTNAQTKAATDLATGKNRPITNQTNNKNTTVNNTFNISGAKEPAIVGNEVYKAAIRSADNSMLVGD